MLDLYAKVSPLTIQAERQQQGYARTVETLLRQALELSDRPKRDAAVVMHGDFAHDPAYLADFVRKLDSGADIVVGEGTIDPEWQRGYRWARRWSAYLLGKSAGIAGVNDPTAGFTAYRLQTLKPLLDRPGPILISDGWPANAELVGRAAAYARRIETVPIRERHDLKGRGTRVVPWPMAKSLWSASRAVRKAVISEVAGASAATSPRNRPTREKGSG